MSPFKVMFFASVPLNTENMNLGHTTAVPSGVIKVINVMYIAYIVNTSVCIPLTVYTCGSESTLRYKVELL